MYSDGLALGIGQCLVDDLVEALTVDYLYKRHSIRLVGDNPNGRCVLNADALAQIEVRLHFSGQLLLRIDYKRKRDAMLLRELLREIANRCRGSRGWTCRSFRGSFSRSINQLLVGKARVAEIIAKLFRLGGEPTGEHARSQPPGGQ